ncbi:MAG: GNAT family N-acetyltransferase [Thermoplasmata archaeon]|nr:GNAT family N-acetyltransferase [Thermoplasmata archaeon]
MVGLWDELVEHHGRLSPLFTPATDSREKWSRYLSKKFSEKSTKLIVAQEDGVVVGFMLCMLSPNAPIFKERTLGIISDVYVRQERRRKGIAKEMLKVALRWFKKNRVKSVQLSVAAANFEARAVWGQLGFKPLMIQKRMDIDAYPATALLAQEPKRLRRKVVRKREEKKA